MFPDLQYLIEYLFGINIPALSVAKTFGLFVAIAFLTAAWLISKELKRYKEEGKFEGIVETQTINKPITTNAFVINGVLGFLLGFKIIGLLNGGPEASNDPMAYIISGQGNVIGGLVFAAVFLFLKWSDKKKLAGKKEEKVQVRMYPHNYVADIIIIAAAAGFAGAKIFNAFESWDYFIQNPIESLISGSGLTYYGGLITATIALYIFAKKKNFSFVRLCDALAPALILAYGIGRLGCQFSGDGDWGIYNSAYITQADGTLREVPKGEFTVFVQNNPALFKGDEDQHNQVPHHYFEAPSWLPTWAVAQNFPHNVNRTGVRIQGDTGSYPTVLPAAVYPTSLWEFFACLLIFGVLMAIRKKQKFPLQLFGIYLIFNGLERFTVEKIRVNYKYDWGFMHPTQAEIISFALILIGVYLWVFNPYKKNAIETKTK